jgi:phospholipid transport system substrate-binding protein
MKMTKKLVTWLAVMLAAALVSSTAWAGEATNVVKANQTELFKVIAQPRSAARQEKLRTLFDEVLAYDRFVVASMGGQWDNLTAGQKKRFGDLLTELIRANYRRNLRKLLDFEIVYEGEEQAKVGVQVNTLAKHRTDKREPPFELDFVVDRVSGKLMIVDIITERASMVKTYRAQFLRILKKDGFDKLIDKMQKKLDKMNAEFDKTP